MPSTTVKSETSPKIKPKTGPKPDLKRVRRKEQNIKDTEASDEKRDIKV